MTASQAAPVLVSFDVDGTLIKSVGEKANWLHREAFKHAFKKVCNLATDIEVVKHHGSTDPLILVKVQEHHGISKKQAMASLPALEQSMVDHFLAHKERAGEGLELLPGVLDLLKALKARDIPRCLVTGNLEPIAWAKMEALGVAELFSQPRFGGFGSDFCSGNTEESWMDRAELVRIANRKAQAQRGGAPDDQSFPSNSWHVGDAPPDVKAAALAGVRALGVCTGIYNEAELREAQPDALVRDSLRDLASVLRTLGASS